MSDPDIQSLCHLGQALLSETRYIEAEETLVQAEAIALRARDWDCLSRLYMPLQEARRQRRQRCGEGKVVLDLLPDPTGHTAPAAEILKTFPHGQLLVAGLGSIAPAVEVRRLQPQQQLYVECFLAAVYSVGGARVVLMVPTEQSPVPPVEQVHTVDDLIRLAGSRATIIPEAQLPAGTRHGDSTTYAQVMAMWETLHLPYLAAANATHDPVRRIEAYRETIRVDYACELAHQRLSDTARSLARSAKQ